MHEHKHEQAVCEHTCLHHCKCCDKVYCCKCGKEWGNFYYNYSWTTTTIPCTITYATCGNDINAGTSCSHSH